MANPQQVTRGAHHPQPIRLASGTGLALLRLGAGPVVCRRVRAPAVVEEHLQSAVQQAGAPTRKYEAKPALHGPFEDTGTGGDVRAEHRPPPAWGLAGGALVHQVVPADVDFTVSPHHQRTHPTQVDEPLLERTNLPPRGSRV